LFGFLLIIYNKLKTMQNYFFFVHKHHIQYSVAKHIFFVSKRSGHRYANNLARTEESEIMQRQKHKKNRRKNDMYIHSVYMIHMIQERK